MGRPRKHENMLMNVALRIMLTAEQKNAIAEAARLEGIDMASWARPILLQAARERIAEAEATKKQK